MPHQTITGIKGWCSLRPRRLYPHQTLSPLTPDRLTSAENASLDTEFHVYITSTEPI